MRPPISCNGDYERSHEYVHTGVVFEVSKHCMPGSGAREVAYFDRFYCRGCLDSQYTRLSQTSNTYGVVLYGATPKPTDDEE